MAEQQVCVIIGAGPGVGMGVARKFGREGFEVALLARDAAKLNELASQLKANQIEARPYPVDAGDFTALQATFAKIRAELGDPQVLVYNSAVLKMGVASELDPQVLLDDLKVNVAGALVAAQAVIPAMRSRHGGTILFTGGGLALYPNAQLPSLGIGKAAIRSLAYSLGGELEPDNIQVATITICGTVQPGTHFDPDTIAEKYWELHTQPVGQREREIVYK